MAGDAQGHGRKPEGEKARKGENEFAAHLLVSLALSLLPSSTRRTLEKIQMLVSGEW
jgi:hypothetical protein